MKQIGLENGYKVTFNNDITEETAKAVQDFANFYFCKQHMSAQTLFDEITTRWNVVPHFVNPGTETLHGEPTEEMMDQDNRFDSAWVEGAKVEQL
jgi:hypothetical protein